MQVTPEVEGENILEKIETSYMLASMTFYYKMRNRGKMIRISNYYFLKKKSVYVFPFSGAHLKINANAFIHKSQISSKTKILMKEDKW